MLVLVLVLAMLHRRMQPARWLHQKTNNNININNINNNNINNNNNNNSRKSDRYPQQLNSRMISVN